jgi:hypothetical protein
MDSSVNEFHTCVRPFAGEASKPLTEAEEARIVLAVLVAFLAGGVALVLRGLATAAAAWQ